MPDSQEPKSETIARNGSVHARARRLDVELSVHDPRAKSTETPPTPVRLTPPVRSIRSDGRPSPPNRRYSPRAQRPGPVESEPEALLAPTSALQGIRVTDVLDLVRRLSYICLGNETFSEAHPPSQRPVGSSDRRRKVCQIGLGTHATKVQRQPGIVAAVQLISHPVSGSVAAFPAARPLGIDALQAYPHTATQSGGIGVGASEDIRTEVAGARLNERVGPAVVVLDRPQLEPQLTHAALQSDAPDPNEPDSRQIDDTTLEWGGARSRRGRRANLLLPSRRH